MIIITFCILSLGCTHSEHCNKEEYCNVRKRTCKKGIVSYICYSWDQTTELNLGKNNFMEEVIKKTSIGHGISDIFHTHSQFKKL